MDPGDLQVWLNHFEHHSQGGHRTPADASDVLEPHERRLIASSIATFQLGEQARGTGLMRATGRFAQANRIPVLERIMELFLVEERHHAALLKVFMEDHGIALKTADWTDRVFRRVRRLAGLELYLHVFICAELIGNVYYRALETVTGCLRLRMLCRKLVADELAHVGFESQLLLSLRARRAPKMRAMMRLAHRTFFVGAAAVVWSTHRSVLRRAGFSVGSFLRACLAQYEFYLEPPLRASRSRPSQISSKRATLASALDDNESPRLRGIGSTGRCSNVKLPLAEIARLSAPLSCSTRPLPDVPLTLPPTVYFVVSRSTASFAAPAPQADIRQQAAMTTAGASRRGPTTLQ